MTNLAGYYPPPSSYHNSPENPSSESKMDQDSLPRLSSDYYLGPQGLVIDDESKNPSASSDFDCDSREFCCPHFARLSTKCIPAWPSLQFTCSLPLGCVFQPFAAAHPDKDAPVVQSTSGDGPLRCSHCQAFINPHFAWEDNGRRVRCNLCSKSRDVPSDYFARPTSVVDFVPPSDIIYSSEPPVFVFVIDISYLSSSSGFLSSVLHTLKEHIHSLPLEAEIALVLFNEAIHFVKFELSRNGSPGLITVADIDDPFVPDPLLFVSPHLLTDQLSQVWDLIHSFGALANPNRAISCATAAVIAASELVADRRCPGTLAVFQASSGKLGKSISQDFTKYCLERTICIDLFASADSVVALSLDSLSATVSELNGEQHFVSSNDLRPLLIDWLSRPRYYNCVIRVRTSKSLSLESIDFGRKKGSESIGFPRLTSESTIGSIFSVQETISPGEDVFLQLACLYTRSDGMRLIRVVNVRVRSTPQAVQVFKQADLDTVGFIMAKQALAEHIGKPQKISVKESLLIQLVSVLHAYRVNCAVSSGSGQLILPDSLKVLPLMLSGFLKQVGIRARIDKTCLDEHIVALGNIQKWNVRKFAFVCLTRMMTVYPSVEFQLVPASRQKISNGKVYLIDRDEEIWFYIGRDVEPHVVGSLFGDKVVDHMLDPRRAPVLDVQLKYGYQPLDEVLQTITSGRKSVRLKCILASSTLGETKLSNVLAEDRIGNDSSYIDWLCSVHRLIQEKIDY